MQCREQALATQINKLVRLAHQSALSFSRRDF